ncbi:sterol O-acyltransferase 1 isoform X2 [Achroia grisella]|uniref:sterol O-acyltransferase 1 isoform X2 n=1 Tax=Achroia grisella TaxID=688607 RepID=UPI0027D2FC4E|nr:sterol O-acyltransferase 1 isoform X2 [Achroia grisella]
MTELRKRTKPSVDQTGSEKHATKENKKPAFTHRESTLTVLIEDSLHIRAIYHIFVAILIMLLIDTVVYDFIERGKINIGLNAIKYGFGEISRGIKLWLYDLSVALAFYPALKFYGAGAISLKKSPGLRRIWSVLGLFGLIGIEILLIAVPIWDLGREHLAVASSVAVTCEMFRYVMKIHAVAVSCIPRFSDEKIPLPTFKSYLYFLFAPTLVYRDEYPRTKKIRWGIVLFHILEVLAIIFYNSFLWERFILPYWSDYGKQPKVEAGTVDWWTTSRFSNYYRAWNLVVYSWLRDHIYKPVAPATGTMLATFIVFFASSVAHEVVLALSFGFFYPVLLIEFGVFGVLLLPLTDAIGRRFPHTLNLLMWVSFFFGNGLLWSLYPMEYFARQNCPPTENDSFFVPKSWSCPEIQLKANWTFQNPFDILH